MSAISGNPTISRVEITLVPTVSMGSPMTNQEAKETADAVIGVVAPILATGVKLGAPIIVSAVTRLPLTDPVIQASSLVISAMADQASDQCQNCSKELAHQVIDMFRS